MSDTRSVTVVTPNGDVPVALGPNHHVVSLLAEVVARSGRTFRGVGAYDLTDGDGNHVGRWTTLAAAGVQDGDRLFLDVNPAGGI